MEGKGLIAYLVLCKVLGKDSTYSRDESWEAVELHFRPDPVLISKWERRVDTNLVCISALSPCVKAEAVP